MKKIVFVLMMTLLIVFSLSASVSSTPNWVYSPGIFGAQLGNSVSSAGDVNGDGYEDVIVGAPAFGSVESNEGCAYLFYGTATGLAVTPAWSYQSNQVDAYLGYSVSSAGDVNNDGYDDVIVGAIYYDNGESNEGAVFAFYGSVSGLPTTPSWTMESNQASAYYGISVASAGDVDNDGYDDILIGASSYDGGESDEGRAWLIRGSSTGLRASSSWYGEMNQASSNYGISVSSAGDVNNDGYDDILIGASTYDNGQTDEGSVFLYYGSNSTISPTPAWSAESNQANSYMGYSATTAGDVNNDGYSDIIVGNSQYNGGSIGEGRAVAFFGSSTGLPATPNWSTESNQASAGYGISVASAGDVNNDGFDDVIIGADGYDDGESAEGRAYVYYGKSTGISTVPVWMDESDQAGSYFGGSVASAGDVNNDGANDIIVGAHFYQNTQSQEGRAFVYYGSHNSSLISNFSLISPTGNIMTNFPTYYWHPATGAVKDYMIYINGSITNVSDTITDTFFVSPWGLPDGEFTWYVIARDTLNEPWKSTNTDTFRVDETPPDQVMLYDPAPNSYTRYDIVTFDWYNGTDNYSGVVSYNLQRSTDPTMTNDLYEWTVTSSSRLDTLPYQGRYYWRARAIDAYGNVGSWSSIWTFEYDDTDPTLPTLVYPIGNEEVEDSNVTFDWTQSTKSAWVYYNFELDTIKSFATPFRTRTPEYDSVSLQLTMERKYYWRLQAVDSAGNTSIWTNADSFFVDVKVPTIELNSGMHNFGEIDINEIYTFDGLYIRNNGDGVLEIDSITIPATAWAFTLDSEFTYPITIQPLDSLNLKINASSTVENPYSGDIAIYTSIYSLQADSFNVSATFGLPCVIDSAKAFDGTNIALGVDADDYVVLFFNQAVSSHSAVTSFNIDDIFELSNSHSWLDGFSDFDTLYPNPANTTIIIELSAQVSSPTISVGDTIFPDSLNIYAQDNGFLCHYPVVIRGSFGTDTTKPSVPVLISPINSSISASGTFLWHSSTDNLAGVSGYSLWYDDDSMFGSPDTFRVTDTTYTASLSDFVYYWRVRAVDNLNNVSSWSTRWSFDYSPAGIYEKFLSSKNDGISSEINVSMNEIKYTTLASTNSFVIYDITGKVIFKTLNAKRGTHSIGKDILSSGIYFMKLNDSDNEINKKVVIVK